MKMKKILLLILLIAILVHGIYGTICGAIENDSEKLISGLVCFALITIFAIVGIVYKRKERIKNVTKRIVLYTISFSCIGAGSVVMVVGLILTFTVNPNFNIMAIVGISTALFSMVFTVWGLIIDYKMPYNIQTEVKKSTKQTDDTNILQQPIKQISENQTISDKNENIIQTEVKKSTKQTDDTNILQQPIKQISENQTISDKNENITEQEQRNAEAKRQMQKEAELMKRDRYRIYESQYEIQQTDQGQPDWLLKYNLEMQRCKEQERKKAENKLEIERQEKAERIKEVIIPILREIAQEKAEQERKSIEYFETNKDRLICKYSKTVENFIDKLKEKECNPFLYFFNNSETPLSSILTYRYNNSVSHLLREKIKNDGLEFTRSANEGMNTIIQDLTDFFIKGLKKRIAENNEWQDEFTLQVLIYYIIRNNVIKYYHNKYIEILGYENLEIFCANSANLKSGNIVAYTYYLIYEENINLPFVETYQRVCFDIKQIVEEQKKKKLENDLFGKSQKKPIVNIVNDTVTKPLSPIERVDSMSGEEFEIFMEEYFIGKGYKVERTPLSGDFGVDLIIKPELGGKIGIQCKCYSKKLDASAVQEIATALRHYGLSCGMVITNNYFQKSAIRLAHDNDITLWDRDMLIQKLST